MLSEMTINETSVFPYLDIPNIGKNIKHVFLGIKMAIISLFPFLLG
jgi:hypothetical protein